MSSSLFAGIGSTGLICAWPLRFVCECVYVFVYVRKKGVGAMANNVEIHEVPFTASFTIREYRFTYVACTLYRLYVGKMCESMK